MFGIGTTEMMIFLVVAVILFGSRLPSVARSLGKSIVEFKKGMRDIEDDLKTSIYSDPPGRVTYNKPSDPPAPTPAAAQHEPQPTETARQ